MHATLAALAYETPVKNADGTYARVNFKDVDYDVLGHSDKVSGYQGTIFQNRVTKDIIVAHRGTEFDRQPFRDGAVDLGVVTSRINAQVSVTGLARRRACTAQINAHRFNPPGEVFNPYGAASLGYRVPEGSPAGAAPFTNHVIAGDVVSATSPHYGTIEM